MEHIIESESVDTLEGEIQTPNQRQLVFISNETLSAYDQLLTWLGAFKPTQASIQCGKTQEGLVAVQMVYTK